MEAIVAAKRRVRVRRVERVGGALGASLAFAHQAQDEGGKAGDAGADDAEAGFDAGPDGDVDGETWGGGLVGIVGGNGGVPVMSWGTNWPVRTMRMVLATQTLGGAMECQWLTFGVSDWGEPYTPPKRKMTDSPIFFMVSMRTLQTNGSGITRTATSVTNCIVDPNI